MTRSPPIHQTCTRWSPHMGLHPGCAQRQGQGQRSRDTDTSVMPRHVCYTVPSDVRSLHALTLRSTVTLSFQYKCQTARCNVCIMEWAIPSLTVWFLLFDIGAYTTLNKLLVVFFKWITFAVLAYYTEYRVSCSLLGSWKKSKTVVAAPCSETAGGKKLKKFTETCFLAHYYACKFGLNRLRIDGDIRQKPLYWPKRGNCNISA